MQDDWGVFGGVCGDVGGRKVERGGGDKKVMRSTGMDGNHIDTYHGACMCASL